MKDAKMRAEKENAKKIAIKALFKNSLANLQESNIDFQSDRGSNRQLFKTFFYYPL